MKRRQVALTSCQRTSTVATSSYILVILNVAVVVTSSGLPSGVSTCQVASCTNHHTRIMDERVLEPGHSIGYCEVLDEYIACLNKTHKECLSTLAYHSAHSVSLKRWKRLDCEVFDIEAYRRQERCHLWPSTHDESQLRFCSLFGHLHLRAFDGYFETCNIQGARPLVDNRFFLIQVTAKPLSGETGPPVLTKVTVIVKASDRCTAQKQFEAASEEPALPKVFTDGSRGEEVNGEKVLQLLHRSDHVEIRLRHVSSIIRIRRHGPYLGVSVRIPERLLHADYEGVNERQLCEAGCESAALDLAEAFAYPEVYLRCHYATSPTMALPLALARCRRLNATDEFFEACVFDLMTSADEKLAWLANDGYLDFRTLMPRTSRSSSGRQELEEYDDNAEGPTELCKGPRFQESWNPSSGSYAYHDCNRLRFFVATFFLIALLP